MCAHSPEIIAHSLPGDNAPTCRAQGFYEAAWRFFAVQVIALFQEQAGVMVSL